MTGLTDEFEFVFNFNLFKFKYKNWSNAVYFSVEHNFILVWERSLHFNCCTEQDISD